MVICLCFYFGPQQRDQGGSSTRHKTATSQQILEPVDEQRIIERELNLQNRLYPRENQSETSKTGNQAENEQPRRHRPTKRQRHRARLNYHRVKCTVCNHAECDAIEEAFLQWLSLGFIVREFKLSDLAAVYRHAHALGLFEKRARQMHHALGLIIEQSSRVQPTADAITRAVRAYSWLDENGQWHEPPRHLIVTHETIEKPPTPAQPGPKSIATRSEQNRLSQCPSTTSQKSIATKSAPSLTGIPHLPTAERSVSREIRINHNSKSE